jgi:succinate dehydrogenase/fumarate reductase cytochrome b subunit
MSTSVFVPRLHRVSGIIMAAFVVIHVLNHCASLFGAEAHIVFMNTVRPLYRNPPAEVLLILAALVQIVSGVQQVRTLRKTNTKGLFTRIRMYSGIYLGLFLLVHLTAVFGFRHVKEMDTNFDFIVPGFNTYPATLFFIPYYSLAVIAFFFHLSAVHYSKMQFYTSEQTARRQAIIGLSVGVLVAFLIVLGYTDYFNGREISAQFKADFGVK